MGSHVGTGYKSNYRPLVSYQPPPDNLDNPAMGYSLLTLFCLPLSCWILTIRDAIVLGSKARPGGSGIETFARGYGRGGQFWK